MNLTGTEKQVEQGRNLLATAQCRLAKELENAGDYEGARAALSGLWTVVGERPVLEELGPDMQAELLLRVGSRDRSGHLLLARRRHGRSARLV